MGSVMGLVTVTVSHAMYHHGVNLTVSHGVHHQVGHEVMGRSQHVRSCLKVLVINHSQV